MENLNKTNLCPDWDFQEWKVFRCQMRQNFQTSFNDHSQKKKKKGKEEKDET